MNLETNTFAKNLEALAQSYVYDASSFAPLYARLQEKVAAFDPDFGKYLNGHLARVAFDTEHFMVRMGYDADVAKKVGDAFALHDIGKIKQDIELWRLSVDKRSLSPEQKHERTKHTDLGVDVLAETMAELGMEPTVDQAKHLDLARHMMLFHHERLDGTGPKAMPAELMDPVLRIVAIVDTVDGKTKAKGLTQIFEDMSGDKHAGQFDDRLVELYRAYKEDAHAAPHAPALAKTGHSL